MSDLNLGYTYWRFKKSGEIVRVEFKNEYALIQPLSPPISSILIDFLLLLTTPNTQYWCHEISKSVLYKYFRPVPKLKQILLEARENTKE